MPSTPYPCCGALWVAGRWRHVCDRRWWQPLGPAPRIGKPVAIRVGAR